MRQPVPRVVGTPAHDTSAKATGGGRRVGTSRRGGGRRRGRGAGASGQLRRGRRASCRRTRAETGRTGPGVSIAARAATTAAATADDRDDRECEHARARLRRRAAWRDRTALPLRRAKRCCCADNARRAPRATAREPGAVAGGRRLPAAPPRRLPSGRRRALAIGLALAALLMLAAPRALRRLGLHGESWRLAPLVLIADRPG